MPVEGTWKLSVSAPVDKIKAVVELRGQDGVLAGVTHGADEEVTPADLARAGDRPTWKQDTAEPVRLNTAGDVTVNGDPLQGTSEAGRLPSSKSTGGHRTTLEHQA